MEDPDWAKILEYIHNNNGSVEKEAEVAKDSSIPENKQHEQALYENLRTELDLNNPSNESIIQTHKHLQNNGLVQFHTHSDYAGFSLKPDGFEVAHEREQNKRSEQINKSIRNLTVILAIAALIQAISTVATVDKPEVFAVIFSSMLFLVIGLVGFDRDWF